ncbi:DedA family protein [Actinobaculum sp. 313]|uniref:DedA family protein n=1 Tax=Actinobaculum sp. 313 TaxID=2495645 RepID=UPI000D529BD1|nr:DedA family protein [Actinobaculum sp. 313]AWE41676.1 alkaline phosphatase [Actinobaculum sp. 313]
MGILSDPAALLAALGPWVLPGVAFILFIESGCLFPFLPGDSLIFTAAMLHVQFGIRIEVLLIVGILAAFLGVQVGYFLGSRFGRQLFKPDARILKTEYLYRAEEFFQQYGAASLILSRFVPIVRTFVPIAAGAARMRYGRFVFFNAVGGVGWVGIMTVAGLFLGQFSFVANNIDVIVVIIVLVSVLPIIIGYLRQRSAKKKTTPATAVRDALQEEEGELRMETDTLLPAEAADRNPHHRPQPDQDVELAHDDVQNKPVTD